MTYYCEDCGFLFRRVVEVSECPSCEGNHLRFATVQETVQLQELLDQVMNIKEETTE